MICPKCMGKTAVVGTSSAIRVERFRKCTVCKYTFQTIEAVKFDDYWKEYAKETADVDKRRDRDK